MYNYNRIFKIQKKINQRDEDINVLHIKLVYFIRIFRITCNTNDTIIYNNVDNINNIVFQIAKKKKIKIKGNEDQCSIKLSFPIWCFLLFFYINVIKEKRRIGKIKTG